ncbi:hypothetical protein ACMFMF_002964 [Clarireedia jacksonii]
MCHYYQHRYDCAHVTKVLAKFCETGGYKQTPCGNMSIWQSIKMGEDCEECSLRAGGCERAADVYVVNNVVKEQIRARRVMGERSRVSYKGK